MRRVLQRSSSDSDLLAHIEDDQSQSRSVRINRSQDDIDFKTPRMNKLAMQRLTNKEHASREKEQQEFSNSVAGSPTHTVPNWDGGSLVGGRIPSPPAFHKTVPLTPEERKEAMSRLLRPNAAAVAGKYVKPSPPDVPEPKDFVIVPIIREVYTTATTIYTTATSYYYMYYIYCC